MSLLAIYFPNQFKSQLECFAESMKDQCTNHLHISMVDRYNHSQLHAATFPLDFVINEHNHSISCKPILPQFQLAEHGPLMNIAIAQWLGKFILDHYEMVLIKRLIEKKSKQTQIEIEEVMAYCFNILDHNSSSWEAFERKYSEEDYARRMNKIAEELLEWIELETECHIEGYIQFRLASYKEELVEVVEYAMDEYVLDQQYKEFMTLLKYFVQLQETKVDLVHLVQRSDFTFELCDAFMRPLELQNDDRIVAEMLETEINIEDIVISNLISASPQNIVIHAQHQEYQVIRTVKSIFGERVAFCVSCPSCRTIKDEIIPFH